jgi:hypothetical protein
MNFRQLAATFLAIALLTGAAAHGDMDMDMNIGTAPDHPKPYSNSTLNTAVPDTYFRHETEVWLLWSHVAIMILAWGFVLPASKCNSKTLFDFPSLHPDILTDSLPTGVFLSIARSRHLFAVDTVFQILHGIGIFVGQIYNGRTPDLYPNNAHHKLGWVLTILVTTRAVLMVVRAYGISTTLNGNDSDERGAFLPIPTELSGRNLEYHNHRKSMGPRLSNDSGQGSDRASSSLNFGHDQSPTLEEAPYRDMSTYDEVDLEPMRLVTPFQGTIVDRILLRIFTKIMTRRTTALVEMGYFVLDRTFIPLGFVGICTGIVAMAGIFVS